MADKNLNSEQDNAYIASLLSKLRESLGQTDPKPDTGTELTADSAVESSPAESTATDVPWATDDAGEESTDAFAGGAVAAEPTEPMPASADEAPAPAVPEPTKTAESPAPAHSAASVPTERPAGAVAPETVDAAESPERSFGGDDIPGATGTEKDAEPVAPAPSDAVAETVNTPSGTLPDVSAASAEPTAAPAMEGRVEDGSYDVPADTDVPAGSEDVPTVPKDAPTVAEDVPTAAAYARTVQPGDPRFSGRNTTGRFLDFRPEDAGTQPPQTDAPSPFDSVLSEPLFRGSAEKTDGADAIAEVPSDTSSPADAEDTLTALFGKPSASPDGETARQSAAPAEEASIPEDIFAGIPHGSAPGSGMPVPDSVPTSDPADNGAFASVWDTLPPLPGRETESPTSLGQEDMMSPMTDDAPPVGQISPENGERLFGRRTRPTLADCTFDADARQNILVDKILATSQDLVPETAKEKQEQLWRQELRHKRLACRIRTIAAGVLLLLSIAVELIPPFPRALLSRLLLTRVPGAVHLIDLQILLLSALIGAPQVLRGFSALRFRRIIPETLLSCGLTVSAITGIYLAASDLSGTYFCALPAVLMVFTSLTGDLFRLRALSRAFDSYMAKGHHFCAVFSDVREHPLIVAELRDAKNPHLFETASASGIENFVSAARKRVECRRAGWITFAVSGVAALLSLILSLATHASAAKTVWAFTLSLVGVMPLTLFGAHRYLFAMLTSRVSEERVGIADELTVYDYAHTGVMTFEDTEAFPSGSVQLSGIKLCGDFRLDKALYLTASVFDVIGGPLNGVFRVSTSDINISDNVDIRMLFDDGIDARVNHDDVLIGTKAFLEARGVSVFRDVEDERAEQGRSGVLYLAYMGTLSAKFHLNYRMSDTFESNVEYYAKHGVTSVIMTADPLLNRAFLDRISYISEYDVRIVKKTREVLLGEEDKPLEATLITYGPRKTLRRMPFFFSAYAKYQAIVIALMIVMAALAAVYVPVLLCFTAGTIPWMPFVTQLIAALPCVIFGFLVLRLNPNK